MKYFMGVFAAMITLCSCAAIRGYSDEEANKIHQVGVYGDESDMHARAQSLSDNYSCEFIGVMTGTSGSGFYGVDNQLSGVIGTYNDALFYTRVTALRNKANALIIKNTLPSKKKFESPNDYVYTVTANAYLCNGDLKDSSD